MGLFDKLKAARCKTLLLFLEVALAEAYIYMALDGRLKTNK